MRHRTLMVGLVACVPLCLASVVGAMIPAPIPLEDLVAQSERIIVAQVLDWEGLDDGTYSYTRTHLRVLWDMTEASGKGGEPDFEDGEMSVVDWTGIVGADRIFDLPAAIFWMGEVVVVCLGRIAYEPGVEVYKDLVGEWKVVRGMEGKRGFNPKSRDTREFGPMQDEGWQRLVDYSVNMLTLLDVEPSQAETLALENLQALRPQEADFAQQEVTSVQSVTWGNIKARFSAP